MNNLFNIIFFALLVVEAISSFYLFSHYDFGVDFLSLFVIGQLILSIFGCCGTALFLYLYSRKEEELDTWTKVYRALTHTNDFEKTVDIIKDHFVTIGVKCQFYERKGDFLRAGKLKINLFGNHPGTNAFFRNSWIEYEDKLYITVARQNVLPCWSLLACQSQECQCHGKKAKLQCWNQTGFTYRAGSHTTWRDKLHKCLDCESFSPFGLLELEGIQKRLPDIPDCVKEFLGVIACAHETRVRHYNLRSEIRSYLTHDAKFGVLNASWLLETLHTVYRSASDWDCISMCMIAIDHSAALNLDCHTMLELHKALARYLNSKSEHVARYGLEDFIILFQHVTKESATSRCNAIRQDIATGAVTNNLRITVSIAIADVINDGNGPESLIQKMSITLNSSSANSHSNCCVQVAPNAETSSTNQPKNYLAC